MHNLIENTGLVAQKPEHLLTEVGEGEVSIGD
jgi:hypothetical protein